MFTIQLGGPHRLEIHTDRYANNNRLAVFALEEGEPFATLSVNVREESMTDEEFAFKTYSENEGLFEQFLAAGAIVFTGRFTHGPLGLPICRLKEPSGG